MNITKDFRNELLKRREVKFNFSSNSNPGNEGALAKLGESVKFDGDCAVVKSIHGNYGSSNFSSEVFIYDSVEDKKNVEPERKEKK